MYNFITFVIHRLGKHFFDRDVTDEYPYACLRVKKKANSKAIPLAGGILEKKYKLYIEVENEEDWSQMMQGKFGF